MKVDSPQPYPVAVIVLAAGESRRFQGKNKLLLPLQGKPLLRHTLDKFNDFPCTQKIVVLGASAEQLLPLVDSNTFHVIVNKAYEKGIATSIQCGTRVTSSAAIGFMFYLADMPFVKVDTLHTLCQFFLSQTKPVFVVPTYRSQRGNPVVISREFRNDLLQLQGDQGARQLFARFHECVREVAVADEGILMDIDSLEDYRKFSF